MAGRPFALDTSDAKCLERIRKLCLLGATNAEIAEVLGIGVSTFQRYLENDAALRETITEGRIITDADVANSLRLRAMGCTVTERRTDAEGQESVTSKELPPDTAAAFIWLKNRRPQDWRDRTEVINVEAKLDLVEYAKEYARRIGPEAAKRFLQDHGYKGPAIIEGELVETPDSSEA
jgi:hypothetical protein